MRSLGPVHECGGLPAIFLLPRRFAAHVVPAIRLSFCSLNVCSSASISAKRSFAARTASGFTGICPPGSAISLQGLETSERRCQTVTPLVVPGSETTVTWLMRGRGSARFVTRRKCSLHRRYAQRTLHRQPRRIEDQKSFTTHSTDHIQREKAPMVMFLRI